MKIGLEKKLKEFFWWWCSEITEHTHILKDRLGIFLAKCWPEIWERNLRIHREDCELRN